MSARLVLMLALCLAACSESKPKTALKAAGAPDALSQVLATCAEVRGEVQVRRAGKPFWEALVEGGALRDGDWVRTAQASRARLEFLAGGSLDLDERAVVVVEQPDPSIDAGAAGATRVAIQEGEVRATPGAVREGGEVAPLTVRTADGQLAVLEAGRGTPTTFRLSASDAGVEVAVMKGSGTVSQGGEQLALTRGTSAVLGQKQAAPVELPEFPASMSPGIDARVQFEPDTVVNLVWAPTDDAVGYRVQVARDLSFTIAAEAVDVTAANFLLKPQSKGLYVWRVASRNARGVVGEYGFARRLFLEVEEPKELLLAPEDGSVVTYAGPLPSISFSWQGTTENPSYRLMVSRSADPKESPVVNLVLDTQRAEVSSLSGGEYHWGVYVEGRVLKPLFLKPRKLFVRSVPRAVVKTPKSINKWE